MPESIPGPDRNRGNPPASDETDSSTSVDQALRYLFQPGVGDGALVVVGTDDSAEGLIAEAGREQPQTLPTDAVDALLNVDAATGGEEPDGDRSGEAAGPGRAAHQRGIVLSTFPASAPIVSRPLTTKERRPSTGCRRTASIRRLRERPTPRHSRCSSACSPRHCSWPSSSTGSCAISEMLHAQPEK